MTNTVPTSTLLRPGDVVGGFRIDDVIGIGGMAIVYRAEQVSLGRPVALKVLSSRLTHDTVFRERFRREGTHAAALEHPNIVPVYDSGEQDGHLYLAMRLVEGTNLAELIQTRGLTADQTIQILRPIASALDTAHAAGLIHRDVKPQNILITNQNHPYLADFGVAKGSNTYGLTATGGFVGSVNYASPEQIKGLTLTPASDVYALTAVLYHCLTGQVPYERETDAGVMHAHLHEPPPSLAKLDGANSDFHTVLARGMAKDSGARYGHAGDLLTAAGLSVSRLPTARRKHVPAFPNGAPGSSDSPGSSDVSASSDASGSIADNAQDPQSRKEEPADAQRARRVADLTAVDVRREPPEPEPEPVETTHRRTLMIAGGAVACVAAAAFALLLAGSGGAGASTYRSDHLILVAGPEWRPGAPAVKGLRLADPVSVSTTSTHVSAGAIADPAKIAAAVPPSVLRTYGAPARSGLLVLPLGRARRFVWTTGHTPLELVVVATGAGELAMLCRATSAAALPRMLAACGQIAKAAKVIGTSVDYPGPDPRVSTLLSRALASRPRLATAVAGESTDLSLHARAPSLARLASADQSAAGAFRRAALASRYRPSVDALASALEREGALVAQAARAAGGGSRARYASLRARAEGARGGLGAGVGGLAALGFVLRGLHAVALPGLPAASPMPERHTAVAASSNTAPAREAPSRVTSAPAGPTVAPEPAARQAPSPSPASPGRPTGESPQSVRSAPE